MACLHQIKLTYGRRWLRLHQHPASGGWGSGGRDHSFGRLLRPSVISVRPPGSGRTDQVLADEGQIVAGAAFITAPSMTTPAVVYRHRAMRSLRAKATMVVLRIRPPRRTRSWNHRLSAEVGWFCSQSQASSTIVVRSRGLPALNTPSS